MRNIINNAELTKVLADYKQALVNDPNTTFARYCRENNVNYNLTRSWLFRYKGLSLLELRTGVVRTTSRVYRMKGRDKHKDIEAQADLKSCRMTDNKDEEQMVEEVVIELPRIGLKTTLKNVPLRQFYAILAAITAQYGEPSEIRKKKIS